MEKKSSQNLPRALKRPAYYKAILSGLLVLAVSVNTYAAQSSKSILTESNPHLRKVSSHLLIARQKLSQGQSMNAVLSADASLKSKASKLAVEIKLSHLDSSLLKQLQQTGLQIDNSNMKYAVVRGYIRASELDELAALSEVKTVQPQYGYLLRNVGTVDNQADATIRADLARAAFSIDGTGLTIGVLSDSFHSTILGSGSVSGSGCNRQLTGSDPQLSGNLPDPLVVLANGPAGTDEGAGMAELIADLAPGANIMFRTAFAGQADFATGIAELVACGADIIVDDVFYFAEPLYQDGFVAKAAQDAVDAGVPYYSSAGNSADIGIVDSYTDVDPNINNQLGDGADFHVFNGGNEYAAMTDLPPGCGATFILEWNQPYSGTLGPGATTDFDLFVCTAEDPTSCTPIAGDVQGDCAGGALGDPLEIGSYTNNTGATQTAYLVIDHFCGANGVVPDPGLELRVTTVDSCATPINFEAGVFDKLQIGGHPAAAGVVAVAAAFYGEVDFNGAVDPPAGIINVEPFSSLGGNIPIYFNFDGTPIANAPELRFKPEITAPDGTNTSFFGTDIGFDLDADPNFFGTSAAAPHAAAVAALMLASSPDMSPAGVNQVLMAAAVDIEAVGIDPLSGAGLIDALDAVQTVTDNGVDCIANLNLVALNIMGNQYFRACDNLSAANAFSVASGARLDFETGNNGSITLGPGFTVLSGAIFDAHIATDF